MLVAISVPFTTFEDTALPPVTRAGACPQSGIPIFMPPALKLALNGQTDELCSFCTAVKGVSDTSNRIRLADLMYFFHEGYRPRASQIEVANLVTEDLRKETAEVRPMMMGAGKQQSSPSVFDRVVLQRYRQGLARSLYIVLPKGLVKQSSHMLATELSPYSLIPIIVHTEEQFGQNPTPGCVVVMNETTCKRLLVTRAEQRRIPEGLHPNVFEEFAAHKRGLCESLDSIQYIFDEVDTLANPITSELNVPLVCNIGEAACTP
jgi:hypothetical protein